MQRIYSLIVAMLLCGFFSDSYSSEAHRINPHILKEKCKSLVIKCFCNINSRDSVVTWERCYYDDYDSLVYDRKGNVLSTCSFDFDWKTHKSIFEYDSLSNRIRSKSYDSKHILQNYSRDTYKYDIKGHILEVKEIETGEAIANNYMEFSIKYKYDENGNQVECCLIDPKAISSKSIYKFNENNKVIEEIHFSSAGKVWNWDRYDYDNHGNRILWEQYNSEDKLTSRIKQKYDNSNNLIDNEEYELTDGKLQFAFRSKLKYDRNNNQIEVNTYNEKGDLASTLSFSYIYDNQGNWTECFEYYKDKPTKKIVRKIEYF